SIDDPEHPQTEAEPGAVAVERIERRPGTITFRAEITLKGVLKRYWLEGKGTPSTYAAYLATDAGQSTRFTLEMDMTGRDAAGLFQIERLDAALSPLNPDPLGSVAWFERRVDEGGWKRTGPTPSDVFDKAMAELFPTPLAVLIHLLVRF